MQDIEIYKPKMVWETGKGFVEEEFDGLQSD